MMMILYVDFFWFFLQHFRINTPHQGCRVFFIFIFILSVLFIFCCVCSVLGGLFAQQFLYK